MNISRVVMMVFALLVAWAPLAQAESADTTMEQTVAVEKVNINTASAVELEKLKGIGKKKAQLIVEYREQYGSFKTAEELTDVKGIGQSILQANVHLIAVE